ncbi:MAG TPA: pyridoxamine 5'-phosphate oxidase family protein [Anaerolineaceae bacterium]|nr:pyridoxamine 5'-phosphate oxidase family protein [Anaerolineaceae bacterium]HOT25247.1 pyridoxamine 5'-phosphate oxidase family protein [Anaerolineaceae bacterium]HQH57813.1 pyridoxamine 5'-phosphate oxidase family protein [Anaerolineaceae bacterium]HQK02903.1 pyridoxamine 5'-phosphate oxidase family protein [Anaerolineaceae bacterium]
MKKLTEEKRKFINAFLSEPLIARLATADKKGQPHVVPVWFAWDGSALWVSAFSSTRKVRDLEENPLISVAIDETRPDGTTLAVILEGRAELLRGPADFLRRQFTWIYARYIGEEHVREAKYQDWIEDPENTLIKLVPDKVYTWQW